MVDLNGLNERADFLDRFYDKLRASPALMRMFADDAMAKRAAAAQSVHWMLLFPGRLDQEYLDSAQKIGLVHSRIGLDPRYYMGGYGRVMQEITALAIERTVNRGQRDTGKRALAILGASVIQAMPLDFTGWARSRLNAKSV